jgi:hypothetical protein
MFGPFFGSSHAPKNNEPTISSSQPPHKCKVSGHKPITIVTAVARERPAIEFSGTLFCRHSSNQQRAPPSIAAAAKEMMLFTQMKEREVERAGAYHHSDAIINHHC